MMFSEPMIGGRQACKEQRSPPRQRPFLRLHWGLAGQFAFYAALVGAVISSVLISYIDQGAVDALIVARLRQLTSANEATAWRLGSQVASAREDAVALAAAPAFAQLIRAHGAGLAGGIAQQQSIAGLTTWLRDFLQARPTYLLAGYISSDERKLLQVGRPASGEIQSAPPAGLIATEREGDFWEFSISDNGIGIDAEFHETVFEFCTHLNSREKHPGSGMGLASCRRIVERHGGRMWVESALGSGSTFYFTLPAGRATEETGDA